MKWNIFLWCGCPAVMRKYPERSSILWREMILWTKLVFRTEDFGSHLQFLRRWILYFWISELNLKACIYQKAVDYVLQGYIIDGYSFNIYSDKVYIRYLESLIYIITICELHLVSYNLNLTKARDMHSRFVNCKGRGRSLSLIVGHTLYIAMVFPANSGWKQ